LLRSSGAAKRYRGRKAVARIRDRADEERRQLLARLPPGPAEAANLATVGIHCRWCDVRHLCSRYRAEAPRLWAIPRNDYPLPLDLWGEVADAPRRNESGEFSLRIRDDAGRQVAIIALGQRQPTLAANQPVIGSD
jgi:hypothetical protein